MAFFINKLGIDLGTANILVYVPGKGIVLNEPSVVAVDIETNTIVAVGEDAKNMIGKTPENIVAYKPMRDGVIADYRVTEAMLRYYINKAVGPFNLLRPDVLISVPSGVTSTERRAVIESATKAGAKNAYVVKESILAAIGAGIPIHEPTGRMIVDIGGGTTDAAVISLGGIVCSSSVKCAGNKMDQAIIDYVKKAYNLAIGDQMAEQIKIEIGSAILLDDQLSFKVKGRDTVMGLPKTIDLHTNEIVKALDKELRQIVKVIKDVMQDTPPELASDIIDNGVILTGGSSQLRYLPELIEKKTGVKAYTANEALFCVAKGTGVILDHLDMYKKSVVSKR